MPPISTKQKLPLNSDGQQCHQYQQNKKLPLNSDGQQIHQYQQNKKIPLNSDGQQFHQYQQNLNSLKTHKRLWHTVTKPLMSVLM